MARPIDFTPWEELKTQIGDVSPGTRLELMTRFAVKPNGKWCIVSIEAVPAPGYDSEGNPENEKQEHMQTGQFESKYNEAMGY